MTTKKIVAGLIFTVFFVGQTFGQNVGISETPDFLPNENAILELKSTLKGFLPPRLTSAERDILTGKGIGTEEEGLMIYNKTRKCNESWTGTKWTSSDPAGTIKAFGGSELPDGWLYCDGSTVSRTDYSDLYNAILEKWGEGDDNTTINLPDLRGQFLRGIDNMDNTVGTGGGIANIDPDRAGRTAKYAGGNTQNSVGSYQGDEFEAHRHNYIFKEGGIEGTGVIQTPNYNLAAGSQIYRWSGDDYLMNSGVEHTGNSTETRPKNAYVNYIIKY